MGKGVKEKITNARLREQQREMYGESFVIVGGARNISYEDFVNGHKVIRNRTIFEEKKKIARKRGQKKKK